MLRLLIDKHLSVINKKDLNNKIIVYYGFNNDFILEVSKKLKLFTSFEDNFNDFGKIKLDYIYSNAESLAKRYFKRGKKPKVMLYEELLVLLTNVNYSLVKENLLLVKNSICDILPNQTNQDFPDIDEGLYKGSISDEPLLSFFYSDSYSLNGINYLKPRSCKSIIEDDTSMKEIDFFNIDKIKRHKIEILNVKDNPDGYVLADQDSEAFIELKSSLNTDNPINKPILLIERSDQDSTLVTLQSVYRLCGLDLKIFKVGAISTDSNLRREITDLFHAYWGGEANFRNLEFYKNPGINREKYTISQANIIEDVINQALSSKLGHDYSDIFITAPTGAGKSLLFQLPAMYLAEKQNKLTIVISPLIALMRDQVMNLKHKKVSYAAFLNSELTPSQREETLTGIKEGKINIVYLSPELLLSYSIETFIGDREVGLLVIDEAHLVTTWGRDFRADYWYIGNYIKRARKMYQLHFPLVALTATAVYNGPEDIVFSTIASLNMHAEKLYIGDVRRDEIRFKIKPLEIKGNHNVQKLENTIKRIGKFIEDGKKTIVYFPWTNQIRELHDALGDEERNKVGMYYGKLDKNVKDQSMRDFKDGKIIVVLATKAFGMGVDVADIDIVYHHAASGSLTDYIQEIGRAARDRKRTGWAISDFHPKDLKYVKILYGLSAVKLFQLRSVLTKIYEIYSFKKEQNFLISTEDFSYLFEQKNRENQVKSALLLIEKDFINKYQFPVVLARPKSLYSQVYCCVSEDAEPRFVNKYGKYLRKISNVLENKRDDMSGTRVKDYGNIYSLKLDELWEDKFVDISFAQLKRNFYNKELFSDIGDVSPRYEFNVMLKNSVQETSSSLNKYLEYAKKLIANMGTQFHSENEIAEIAYQIVPKRSDARKLVNLLITLYVSSPISHLSHSLQFDTFIQSRKQPNSDEKKYKVYESGYSRSEHFLKKRFSMMFGRNNSEYKKFVNSSDIDNPNLKLAFALEILGLASYQISGGQLPKIFIRVNDPYKLKKLFEHMESYTNNLLEDIKSRQKYGVDKMENFLITEATDNERWDTIESYFLNID